MAKQAKAKQAKAKQAKTAKRPGGPRKPAKKPGTRKAKTKPKGKAKKAKPKPAIQIEVPETLDRVAIVFSGGPAPGGNAVISTVATQLLNDGVSVVGLLRGFQYLSEFEPRRGQMLIEGEHYIDLKLSHVTGVRHLGGTILKTSRANPGKMGPQEISSLKMLADPVNTEGLRRVIAGLKRLRVDALVTIGGDDTLKTANYLRHLGVNVVHVPKTIDNDYYGIAWTFGYFTAIDVAKDVIANLYADARSTNAYFVVECMGRKSGWYTYGAGVAGLAVRMVAVEDIEGELDMKELVNELVDVMLHREQIGKKYGVICVSEGLADLLPAHERPKRVDEHGNPVLSDAKIAIRIAHAIDKEYRRRTGKSRKVVSKLVGYETRSAKPCAYDVLLGSQLGMGAYRMVTEGQFGHMVSVGENLDIEAIPFDELIDPRNLRAHVRFVPTDGDFYRLKQALEYRAETDTNEPLERVEAALFGGERSEPRYRQR